ncbi:T9SS type A sorting domain-containing protein [Flavobacterium sp. IMCC34852]|uniref:T9SS type A sorting domain-containing protein n=1 Tax=Flavobacterium rivulicola TaxID=2732161 RepID=A0A7Y3R912_9FLAO|nr:T9SS type A sorting domain-containing protein [Flavobacterium sp. IMCC34852]NNT72102.1 T9SS type A sorting domain-containing protein [Flavobacterium sp. IMCC34852]
MKQKLLFLFLLTFSIAIAKPKEKTTVNPAIGILMSATNFGVDVFYNISIKNTGEETLTNVFVTQGPNTFGMTFWFGTIATLAPGEEITGLTAQKLGSGCYDQSQVIVHATPSSTTTEITDLSSDPFGYDNNGLPGTYYNNLPTTSSYFVYVNGTQDGVYQDLNNNSIVDVGDVINYTYTVSGGSDGGEIYDSNAIVTDPVFTGGFYITTGIHYITQADVDLGYVYNNSYIISFGPCDVGGYFDDESYCACPNPNGANIVTPLTSLLPNRISGNVKFNTNNDNCTTGLNFPNRRVNTTDGTYTYASYTNAAGNYQILIPNVGNYTTSALTNLNANFTSNPSSTTTVSSGSGVNYNNTNYCISSAANFADLTVNMFNINQAIPGNAATYRIVYTNHGSTNLNGSVQLTFDNGKLTFGNSTPIQNSSTTNTLTWNYTNLLPFESRQINLSFNVLIPPAVNVNDLLNFTVVANPIAGDSNVSNNTMIWEQIVRSSFDPNDKTVIEGSTITTAEGNNYLTYVTRFQNTGTANATTVVIKETLDADLDWNTFEPIASSHTADIQLRYGNDLTYTFSNIDLPYESANEPASNGWMVYKIKPKSNFTIGDIASSNSNIYFDYNPPILTNTVTTEMVALSINETIQSNFTLYPNPTSNHFVVEMQNEISAQYEIFDLNGKRLQANTVQHLKPIDISAFQSGFYFVTINTEQGKATYKLVKN